MIRGPASEMAWTRALDTWRVDGARSAPPWKAALAAVADLVSRLRLRRRLRHRMRVSDEWLHQHEVDSLKHPDAY